jgi:hypothetical protein
MARSAAAAGLFCVVLSAGAAEAFTPSNHVSFTLEGCRNDGSIVLPIGGKFICPDAAYTTGNLGKGWNELDLVPHRLTTDSGNQTGTTTTYDVYIADDYQTGGKTGYDVISVPVVNTAKSHASCTVSAGAQSTQGSAGSPFGGGTDVVIYRQLTIHQDTNTKCVLDWFQRLALGAHLYPGSSLQSYMFDQAGLSGSKKTISIPVNQILPQELSEDMSATEGTDHAWNLTKSPNPATLSFGNTCDPSSGQSKELQITVTWTKLAAQPSGAATIIANVYATNPAARVVTVNVTDKIYAGLTQTNLLDTATTPVLGVDVPPNTTQLVLTHTFVWNNPTDTNVNAVATATYTDKVTGVPIPGQTTASASAAIQLTGPETNATATIDDVETISEVPACGTEISCTLEFSADSFSGASGAFDSPYTAGTKTLGPVSWTSASQSGSGSVTFNKTVYVPGPEQVNGSLHDTATLTGSNAFTTSASANVALSADAKVTLTINKTIPNVLTGSETATFTFHVFSGIVEVATPSLTFVAGDTAKSVPVGNLVPGNYTVTEDVPPGWQAQGSETADLTLPDHCTNAVTFNNDFARAKAQVTKVTVPPGSEAGWTFQLLKSGSLIETVISTDASFTAFTTPLTEGSYSIVEVEQDGWTNNGGTGDCSFTVDYPAHAGKTFSCQYTNTFHPTITLDKTGPALSKIGDLVSYTITLTNTSSGGGPAGAPSLVCTITDTTIGFSKTVTLAPGGSDTSTKSITIPVGASDPFVNTATASCHYSGAADVVASASASHSINLFQPSIVFSKTADTHLSQVGKVVNYTLTLNNTSSADSPALVCNVVDAKLGVNKSVTLASGHGDVTNVPYTVQAGDPDPLVNEATVSCSPTGFPNVLADKQSWTVNLFQPSLSIAKTGPRYSKAGDTAFFTVTIVNTSSADSPNLVLDSFTDSVVSNVTPPAACSPLAPGASCTFSYAYVVKASDPDPLVNIATVHYHPTGFATIITRSSTSTTDLLHPGFTVAKTCKAQPVSQAGPAVFTIAFTNTGDAALHVVPSEGAPFDVAAGASPSYDYSVNGPFSATVNNTVTGVVTLDPRYGLSNSYTFSASGSCTVESKAKVVKTVSGQPPAAGQTFTFQLRQGATTASDGTILQQVNTDSNGNISFTTSLVPGQTYQMCEWVFPGWNTNLAGNGALFVPNSIIPPSLPNPNVNNLTVCTNFTVTSGQTRIFTVDNTPPPGGRALTIGFWKNWASCAGSKGGQKPTLDLALGIASANTTNPPGGLVVSAQNAGSGWPNYAPAFYLVLKGDPTSTQDNIKPAPGCAAAVNLLDKRTTGGVKQASDPLFNMTAQLIAAELNRYMGAAVSGTTITNINRAVLLDGKYSFNGATYTPKLTAADTTLANCLATQLDNYNNGRTVSACP